MILKRKTWVYQKGNTLYVSDAPLKIKGATKLSNYDLLNLVTNNSFEEYLFNPTIKYYLNDKCIFSAPRYFSKEHYYIVLKDKNCFKMRSKYKYYNTNKIRVIPISTTIFDNIYIDYIYHEEIYQEYE